MDRADFQELRRKAEGAREFFFQHAGTGIKFAMRYPTTYDMDRLMAEHRVDGKLREHTFARALVETSLIGWEGVRVAHAFPEAKNGGELLPFDPDAVALLMEEQVGWLFDLAGAVMDRWRARRDALEADVKN